MPRPPPSPHNPSGRPWGRVPDSLSPPTAVVCLVVSDSPVIKNMTESSSLDGEAWVVGVSPQSPMCPLSPPCTPPTPTHSTTPFDPLPCPLLSSVPAAGARRLPGLLLRFDHEQHPPLRHQLHGQHARHHQLQLWRVPRHPCRATVLVSATTRPPVWPPPPGSLGPLGLTLPCPCSCQDESLYWYTGSRCSGRVSKVATGLGVAVTVLLIACITLTVLLVIRSKSRKR